MNANIEGVHPEVTEGLPGETAGVLNPEEERGVSERGIEAIRGVTEEETIEDLITDEDVAEEELKEFEEFAEDLEPGDDEIPEIQKLNLEAEQTVAEFLGEEASIIPLEEGIEEESKTEPSAEKEEVLTPDAIFTEKEWQAELDENNMRMRFEEVLGEGSAETHAFIFEPMTDEQQDAWESIFSEDGEMSFFVYYRERRRGQGEDLEALFSDESSKDKAREDVKLLLRLAVKVGAKAAVILARNIAEEMDDEAASVIFGTFADYVEGSSDFFDSVMSEDGEKLEEALRARVSGQAT